MKVLVTKNYAAFVLAASLGLTALLAPVAADAALDDNYEWKMFEDVDVDRSGYIEDGEYVSYTFGMADWDDDGYLEDTEWASYTENFYDVWDLDYDSVTYYDTNGDGLIEWSEFNEFAVEDDGLFDSWDVDDDDVLDGNDWDQVTVYYQENE